MRTLVAAMCTVLACTASVVAGHAGDHRYEEHRYGGVGIFVTGCVPDLGIWAFAVGCVAVLPGETSATIRILDAIMNPIAANYGWADIGGHPLTGPIALFCGSTVLAIPPGVGYIEIQLVPDVPGPCAGKYPTTGRVLSVLS